MRRFRSLARPTSWTVTIILFWLTVVVSWPTIVAGQMVPDGWNPPVNLSNTSTHSQTPSIAADPSGGVHVIWSEEVEPGRGVIYYSRLEGENWTAPLDILVPPGGGVPAPVLRADAEGNLYVVWGSGGSIYYSYAYAPEAGSARGWSEPQALVMPQNNLGNPDFKVGADGNLYMAYAKRIGDDSGIYLIRSTDGGRQWSNSIPVYENRHADRTVDKVRLAIAPEGTLHVVWVESNYPRAVSLVGVRYSSSHDGGDSWREPYSLADGPYDWPEIVVRDESEVHVVWSGTSSDRFKFHRWSPDGGQNWSEIWRNTDLGGLTGWPALVVDGDQTLHWIQVGDVFHRPPDSGTSDKVYYQYWRDGSWSAGVIVLSGFTERNNMDFVAAAVALGKELHVVVQVPLPEAETYQWDIMYLHRTLDSRSIPARPLPTLTTETQVTPVVCTPTATERQNPTPSAVPTIDAHDNTPSLSTGQGWSPLVLGIATSMLLCVVTLAVVLLRKRR